MQNYSVRMFLHMFLYYKFYLPVYQVNNINLACKYAIINQTETNATSI